MAVNQHVNKVILNGTTLMDVSDNTITDEDMMEGVTATMPDGSTKTGKMRLDDLEDLADARGGIRYNNGNFQVYDVANETWVTLEIGGGSNNIYNPLQLYDTSNNLTCNYAFAAPYPTVTIKWTDPNDAITTTTVSGGQTILAEWAATKIVKKIGSYPESPDDGIEVIEETTRNQYITNGYVEEISTADFGKTFYYAAFFITKQGAFSRSRTVRFVNIEVPSWSTSSATLIQQAIQYSDDGLIDLYEDLGWRVGDRRTFLTSNGLRLVHHNPTNYTLATPTKNKDGSNKNHPTFIVYVDGNIYNGSNMTYYQQNNNNSYAYNIFGSSSPVVGLHDFSYYNQYTNPSRTEQYTVAGKYFAASSTVYTAIDFSDNYETFADSINDKNSEFERIVYNSGNYSIIDTLLPFTPKKYTNRYVILQSNQWCFKNASNPSGPYVYIRKYNGSYKSLRPSFSEYLGWDMDDLKNATSMNNTPTYYVDTDSTEVNEYFNENKQWDWFKTQANRNLDDIIGCYGDSSYSSGSYIKGRFLKANGSLVTSGNRFTLAYLI